MTVTKPLHELTLDEINEELEFIGATKQYKRIDAARRAIIKLVDTGDVLYSGKGKFVDVGKLEKLEKPEPKAKVRKKAEPKVFVPIDDPNVGNLIFCRFGKQKIAAVGYYEGDDKKKLRAKLANDKIVALSSCRGTAVDPDYRGRYAVDNEIRTTSGKPSIGVEDDITDFLKGATVDTLMKVCDENNLEYERWRQLNAGMQRMCIGNRLRGMLRNGHRVVIKGKIISEGALASDVA